VIPASYQIPAAIVLVLGGTVACFFGYRLFRIVLAIFGFILGFLAASSLFGVSDTVPMLVTGLLGGLVGAAILLAAYFVGVALVGAGIGAFFANLAFAYYDREPPVLVLIMLALTGAVAATYLQRYFIIVGTSFGGAWTLIVGAMAIIGDPTALAAAAAGDVWVAYPLNPAPGQQWVPIVWVLLGLIGTGVQMGWTGGEKGRVGRRRKKS
jgi:hypothetical protein